MLLLQDVTDVHVFGLHQLQLLLADLEGLAFGELSTLVNLRWTFLLKQLHIADILHDTLSSIHYFSPVLLED